MATWEGMFTGHTNLIRKMLFGSALVCDYVASGTFGTFTPFASDGSLSASGIAGGKVTVGGLVWTDLGYLTDDGVAFARAVSGSDVMGWQSRSPLRHDITSDVETAHFMALETKPSTMALYNNLLLTSGGTMTASGSYALAHPQAQTVYRSMLFLGSDGTGSQQIVAAKLYPYCSVTDLGDKDWKADTPDQFELTVTPYVDPNVNYDVKTWIDGPGWRALTAAA